MKYLAIVLVLLAAAAGRAQSPNPAQASPVAEENIQKAQRILNQAIQALGGSAYLNIQEMSSQGRTYALHHGRPSGGGVEFWRFYKYPDKDRIELTKDRDWLEIFNGDKGYEITFRGTEQQKAKDVADYVRRRKFSLIWVLRKWLHAPGVALFYEGQNIADGKQVDQVSLLNAQNQGVTLFIDTSTHLPVKKTYSWRDPDDHERDTEDEVYGNYRPIQGVMTPYTVTRYYNGEMSNQVFLNSVTYNETVSDSEFDPATATLPRKK